MKKTGSSYKKNDIRSRFEEIEANFREDVPGARKELRELMAEGRRTRNVYVIGAANFFLGLINFRLGLRSEMLSYALKASAIFRETDDHEMIARSANLLGIAYSAMEEYALAVSSYKLAYQTITKHPKGSMKKSTLNCNMAESYFNLGDTEKAISLAKKCLFDAFKKDPDNHTLVAIVGINLAEYYETAGDYEKAEEIVELSKPSIKELESEIDDLALACRQASIAYSKGDIENGKRFADVVIEITGRGVDTYELHRDYEKIARAQIKAGDYDRADKLATLLWDYAKKTDMTIDKITAYRLQAEYFDATHNAPQALRIYRRLNELYERRTLEMKEAQLSVEKQTEAMNREVQRIRRQVKEQEKLIEREPLTKLLNRNALPRVMGEFMETATEKHKKIGAIFIDIDYFKEFNDTYGHTKGDAVIRTVSKLCLKEECARIKFARYGGDEFFGVILGHTDEQIAELARRIYAGVKKAKITHAQNLATGHVTLSIGLVNINMTNEINTLLDIVNYADKALYHAKNNGRNCIYASNLPVEETEDYEPYVRISE